MIMIQDSLTSLYKLIVLYMLDKVSFPLTAAQISSFVVDQEYTGYLTIQQAISELTDDGLVLANSSLNKTLLTITAEGQEMLHFFGNRISDAIKEDVAVFFAENQLALRNEVSVLADYYKAVNGEYEARLVVRDEDVNLVELTLSVPLEELAVSICDNWQKKSQKIYKHLVEELF